MEHETEHSPDGEEKAAEAVLETVKSVVLEWPAVDEERALVTVSLEEAPSVVTETVPIVVVDWVFIATALSQGAIGWVGAKVFEKIFGGGKESLSQIIADVIQMIRSVVRAEIDRNELRNISASLDQLQTDLLHYLNAPYGKDRLEHATNNASSVVSKLAKFGRTGHGGYLIALSLHVAILQERVKAYGRAEKKNIAETLGRGIAHAEFLQADWSIWLQRRYVLKEWHRRGPNLWVVSRDGAVLRSFFNKEEAEKFLDGHFKKTWQTKIYPQYVKPSEFVVADWKKLLQSLGLTP